MISRDQLLDDLAMRLQLLQALMDVTEECEKLPVHLLHEVAWCAFRQMPQESNVDWYSGAIRNLIHLRLGYKEAMGVTCG